jgi:hypothetical protein
LLEAKFFLWLFFACLTVVADLPVFMFSIKSAMILISMTQRIYVYATLKYVIFITNKFKLLTTDTLMIINPVKRRTKNAQRHRQLLCHGMANG